MIPKFHPRVHYEQLLMLMQTMDHHDECTAQDVIVVLKHWHVLSTHGMSMTISVLFVKVSQCYKGLDGDVDKLSLDMSGAILVHIHIET